jgi:glycosyltransferase involved in cell wall biosynthesis
MTSPRVEVLQVTTSTQRRGAEIFALQLGEELRRRGHGVTTVALSASARPERLPFEPLGRRRFDPRAMVRLVGLARAHDVVVAHGGASLVPVAGAGVLSRRPSVYRNIGDPSFWGGVRGADLRIGWPLRRAAAVVALYERAGRFMADRYRLDRRRISVISNAVDADRFPARDRRRRTEARAALGLSGDRPVLGYLGALSDEKRPDWAIDLVERLDDTTLLVAGDGPRRAQLAARVSERAALADRVRFVGPTSEPESFLAALDALVLPSRTEGVPGVLLEAALVGVPVVATDVGGVGEVIGSTGSGVTVDVEDLDGFVDAVRSVLAQPADFVARRDDVLGQHGMARIGAEWERVLLEVVSSTGRRRGQPAATVS